MKPVRTRFGRVHTVLRSEGEKERRIHYDRVTVPYQHLSSKRPTCLFDCYGVAMPLPAWPIKEIMHIVSQSMGRKKSAAGQLLI